MKLLMMGGTLFVGRVVVEQALAAGHEVTTFNRGRTGPDLFGDDVEQLRGDRNVDLSALHGRRFDAVIDTSGYIPRQVTAVVEALDGRFDHYGFVSSMSVYAAADVPGTDESAPLATVADDTEVDDPDSVERDYGALKALCERALDDAAPGRVLHARAGLIVGPHDNTGRFPYWVARLAAGGDVLAPEPKDQPVQVIDVNDLARWLLLGAGSGTVGPFNLCGDPGRDTMASMLGAIANRVGSDARLRWVDEAFLVEREVAPWSDLPLWLPPGALPTHVGFMLRSNAAARAAGLELRPLTETIDATAEWLTSVAKAEAGGETRSGQQKDFGNPPAPAGLTVDREQALLAAWEASTVR